MKDQLQEHSLTDLLMQAMHADWMPIVVVPVAFVFVFLAIWLLARVIEKAVDSGASVGLTFSLHVKSAETGKKGDEDKT